MSNGFTLFSIHNGESRRSCYQCSVLRRGLVTIDRLPAGDYQLYLSGRKIRPVEQAVRLVAGSNNTLNLHQEPATSVYFELSYPVEKSLPMTGRIRIATPKTGR